MGAKTPKSVHAEEVVTPAVAKSIDADTENAVAKQSAERAKLRGISSTYLRGQELASTSAQGKAKLGQ